MNYPAHSIHRFRSWRIALCAATFLIAGTSHAAVLRVQTLNHANGTEGQRIPFVVSDNAAVADRINQRLFIDLLERMAPKRARDGLREVDEQTRKNLPILDFRVVRNDAHVLSLTISGEGCGAYCETFDFPHAFDATTGRHLEVADLFTPAGREEIARAVQMQNTAAVGSQIDKIKAELTTADPSSEDSAYLNDELALYQTCVASPASADWRLVQDVGEMTVEGQSVTFTQGRCSNHAGRAVDALGNFENRFSITRLRPWLSAYGLALLVDRGTTGAPLLPFGQVLRGKIDDQLPITLWLRTLQSDGSISGVYFYDRYRMPIDLFGKLTDGVLELKESGSGAEWSLEKDDGALRGGWHGAGKNLSVVVGPG